MEIFIDISVFPPLPPPQFYLFVYYLAELGLHCCVRTFSNCGEQGCPYLGVQDSHCAGSCYEHVGFHHCTSACGFFLDQVKPMSLELAGGFLNHWPSRKVLDHFLIGFCCCCKSSLCILGTNLLSDM